MPTKENRFSYRSIEQLRQDAARRGLDLPFSRDTSILASSIRFGRLLIPNRMVVQPMEGCDANDDGSPGELTERRYRRFAAGGAGMIWFEACAVVPQGRANPRQLWLHEGSLEGFNRLVEASRRAAAQGPTPNSTFVLQLTHSGRYSRPGAKPSPIIAHHSAVLDHKHSLPADYPLISDAELDSLQDAFVKAAMLAAEAGFDAVDIKACHRYLLSELLASFTRRDSRYGGAELANRARMLLETFAKVTQAVGDRIEVTCRLNAYDAIEHPYGWGVDRSDAAKPDLSEPLELIRRLRQLGLGGINVTIGNPYFNPHVNRPADWMIANWPEPAEHPLDGVARILAVVRPIQQALPDLPVIGSGYSWLRHYYPQVAAGAIEQGWASLAGLGRGALAYPDFAADILAGRGMDGHKACIACSSCTQIMRDGLTSGCVIRDHEAYGPIFREGRHRDGLVLRELAGQCRQCADAMCVTRCPAGVDVPGFLGTLADGDERAAYDILRRRNVLPEACGRVCPVEVQCQSACVRNYMQGEPVPIGEIQRQLARRACEAGWPALCVPAQWTGRTVAVIGAGPAGLAAAAELLRQGHKVAVMDRAAEPGGKLATVIPAARLPRERLAAEIRAVFGPVPPERLEWRFGQALGPNLTLDDVLAKGYDAVVLALGLGNAASLSGAGGCEGVMDACSFLRQMNRNADHACPPRVAVLGGGNTAVDAAVLAKDRGAQDVYLVYRRSYSQMPAWPAERDQALHAGVHLMFLCQPLGYVVDKAGRLAGLRIARTVLGLPRPGAGRREAAPVPGSEFVLEVDLALEALGERMEPVLAAVLSGVDLTDAGLVKADPLTLRTSRARVWAAGDLVNGGTTVVQAIAQGRAAAEDVDAMLSAKNF